MPDAMHMGPGSVLEKLSEYALDFPRAYSVLTDMLSLSDMNDHFAGYGVLQGPALWVQSDLSHEDYCALLTLSNDDAALLYLLLRAKSLNYWENDKALMEAVRSHRFPWRKVLTHVRKFVSGFGGDTMSAKIAASHKKHYRVPRNANRGKRHDRRKNTPTVS
jgi:hypothetical protein